MHTRAHAGEGENETKYTKINPLSRHSKNGIKNKINHSLSLTQNPPQKAPNRVRETQILTRVEATLTTADRSAPPRGAREGVVLVPVLSRRTSLLVDVGGEEAHPEKDLRWL